MKMNEATIYLKVISPIHIGGAQEKHLKAGLDYFDSWRINEKELYHPERGINPDELAQALCSGNSNALRELISKRKDKARFIMPLNGHPGSSGEVKAFIRSGNDGAAYIPGSSIKGAMRSAIANYLCNGHADRDPDKEFIKDFENSLFRLVIVSDSTSFNPVLYRSKIATIGEVGGAERIKWKASGKINDELFSANGFDTSFESPALNNIIQFRISINQKLLKKFGDQLKGINKKSVEFITQDDILHHFLQVLNQYTLDYLAREIQWFNKYHGNQSDTVVKTVERLKQAATLHDQFLLHLGFGSGFHAMTGDWQYTDHTATGAWSTGYHSGKPKYKTRRVAFDQWPNPGYFGPMGYALLSQTPFPEYEKINSVRQTQDEEIPQEIKPEVKPIHRKVAVRQGVILDGVVKENKMVDVYMPDGTIKPVSLVSGTADAGKVIEVAIFPDGKGNFRQASFKGYKK